MKNKYEIHGEAVSIFLRRQDGTILETLIDLSDFDKINKYSGTWIAKWVKAMNGFYASYSQKGPLLHRLITNAPSNMLVDHINHNTLDNRKANLRICNSSENQLNRAGAQKNSITGIRNVIWDKRANKYRAELQFHKKHFCVGYYTDPYEAGRMANAGRKMAEMLETICQAQQTQEQEAEK